MDELNRRKDRTKIGDVKYTSLNDNGESGSMARYKRPCLPSLMSRILAGLIHPKTKYVIAIAVVATVILWWTTPLWWPKPQPIQWSDTMRKKILWFPEDKISERIVHFDLKGAALRVEYFENLFPLLTTAGATGLLIEWEDMLPYEGPLAIVRHGDAYEYSKFREILEAAKKVGLRIVPLVQTFGHMEWVLKHQQFAKVREVPRYPQVVCPSYNESLALVKTVIDNVVKAHDGYIDTIHIGADEAYHVGAECTRCQKRIAELGGVDRVMLEYVTQVVRYIKDKHKLRVMMWNDMFDKTDPAVLRSYGMNDLVEPVIWGYAEDLLKANYFPDGVFDRFGEVFDRLWLASAYKGANWPDQPFVNLKHYALNHLSWLQVVNYSSRSLKNSVKGIILTGWQRFDHFAILCELLPAATPSLVFNLQIIKLGGMEPGIFDITRKVLNCRQLDDWKTDVPEYDSLIERFFNQSHIKLRPKLGAPVLGTVRCEFPGSEVYALTERLRYVKHEYDLFMNSSIRRGWMHEYNRFNEYGSVHHAEITHNVTQALLYHFSDLGTKLRDELSKLYFDDTVTEWLFNNVQMHINELRKLSLAATQMMHTVEFRNRPLTHMKLDL